jgi:hypothetical protein
MANVITVSSYTIYPKGESMLSENSYTVSRDDEGAGEFITIADGLGNTIRIDPEDMPDILKAVQMLIGATVED